MCLGKALALVPDLSEAGAPRPTAAMLAGAEANVAVGLAGAGVAAAWVGRWARDELGAFLHAELARSDVDVGDVVIDPHPPDGPLREGHRAGRRR